MSKQQRAKPKHARKRARQSKPFSPLVMETPFYLYQTAEPSDANGWEDDPGICRTCGNFYSSRRSASACEYLDNTNPDRLLLAIGVMDASEVSVT